MKSEVEKRSNLNVKQQLDEVEKPFRELTKEEEEQLVFDFYVNMARIFFQMKGDDIRNSRSAA